MAMQFVKATKKRSKLRLAIDGPSGSGKTYTALTAATAIAEGGKIAVIDTERGSASLYSDRFQFDVLELDTFSPKLYIEAIEAAEQAGYAVIVIDSLSHAWEGEGGALDMVDHATQASPSKNSYYAWKNVTPLQRDLVDAMLQSKAHIVATMRSKTEYVETEVTRNGRSTKEYRKVGTAPVQRAGIEYEFTIFADMDLDHNMVVTKSRFEPWGDLMVENRPSVKFFAALVDWLNSGEAVTEQTTTSNAPAPTNGGGKPQAPEPVTQAEKDAPAPQPVDKSAAAWAATIAEIAKAKRTTPEKLRPLFEFSQAGISPDTSVEVATVWLDYYSEARKREAKDRLTPQEAGAYADEMTAKAFDLGAIN